MSTDAGLAAQREQEEKLALVRGILEGAFFSPLMKTDWPGFFFGQPGLLGLEQEEAFDIFIRAALAQETLDPDASEGRLPLGWLLACQDHGPLLAQVMASLRQDRPLLFHRFLWSLPSVRRQEVDPDQFDLVEDFLATAIGGQGELAEAAAQELEVVRDRALKAAGVVDRPNPVDLLALAQQALSSPEALACGTDLELIMHLMYGGGLDHAPEADRPGVMVLAWEAWARAVLCQPPDPQGLATLWPELAMEVAQLAAHAPVDPGQEHVLRADCPVCGQANALALGTGVRAMEQCPHLVFVGSSDEAHVAQALKHFDLGQDFWTLLDSYYQSPADMDLYANLVDDLLEMFRSQKRLFITPVNCATAPQSFHFLRAYFAGPPPSAEESDRAH